MHRVIFGVIHRNWGTIVKHSIEVAHLVNGEVMSVRRLSRRREVRETAVAVAVVAAAFTAATALVGAVLLGSHRVVYGPVYGGVWVIRVSPHGQDCGHVRDRFPRPSQTPRRCAVSPTGPAAPLSLANSACLAARRPCSPV